MKTVKFYNKTTGRWEPIAGISTTGGVSDYNDLSNKPDLSVYALKSELDALREELTNLINSQEPDSHYYTEYTIDNSASTFSLRSVDNPINNGQYIPQFSGGYDYIKLTLTNGNVTTNLNTSASEVERIKIYYPAGTSYVKFTDTKVKDVEHIECSNFTDATSMFKNCVSLEHADLSTLDSSKVTVDNTMFAGANYAAYLVFNDQWSYTNRDMGLIKYVDVVMHHYREDGLYEYNAIYIKSQYDENPIQYVIRQVDPVDERWRLEPLSLEYDTPYEIYFEDSGFTGETMNARFMSNMDIFFVGALPNSFTESRPEIGGNEEPEVEYITGFSVSDSSLGFSTFGNSYSVTITPNETGRPMNFVVDELENSNFKTGIDYNIQNTDMGATLQVSIRPHASYSSGQLVIRETYSNTTQTISVTINPKISLTVHYKATDDDYYEDTLALNFDVETQEIRLDPAAMDGTDDYGYHVQLEVPGNSTCPAVLQHNNPNFNGMTMMTLNTTNSTMSIWISDDSSEILYENPNQPEEPDTPEEPSENSYYVQYTIDATDADDEVGYSFTDAYNSYTVHKYLPHTSNESEKIEIILNDGTITSDLTTKVSDVNYIKYYYPSETSEIKFREGTVYINESEGTTEQIYNRIKTLDHISLEGTSITSLSCLCQNCKYLESVTADFYLNNINDISYIFNYCSNLTSIDVSNWNTSNVNNMNNAFYNCSSLTSLDVSKWNVNNVGDMSYLFAECKNLESLDVSNWNTQCVYNMSWLFGNCYKIQELDVSNWNTSNVTSMTYMFSGIKELQKLDVSNWNTSNVTDMSSVFQNCQNLQTLDVSNWDTGKVTNMSYMFHSCKNLQTLDVSNWDTGNVSMMVSMFYYCHLLQTLDVSNWNVNNVYIMNSMFSSCRTLTSLYLGKWNTGKLEDIHSMFSSCQNLQSLDLTGWDTSKVTENGYLFSLVDGVNITVSEGLWTLDTTHDAYRGTNLTFNIIPCDITSLNVTTDIEDLNNLNTHKIKYSLSIQPEANGIFDLETIYDATYIKLSKDTITLLEGAQGKPLSVTFRSKRNNEISQTIEFTLNADYVIPTFDGTIDFTELDPKFPSWMEEYSSGDYTFELGTFNDGVDGLVSNNTNVDMSVAYKAYQLTPEEALNMTINYRCESENGCDYLTVSLRTSMDGFNTTDPYDDDSNYQILTSQNSDYVYEDASFTTNLEAGVTYYLVFRYRKDGSSATGVDKACIRSIKFE